MAPAGPGWRGWDMPPAIPSKPLQANLGPAMAIPRLPSHPIPAMNLDLHNLKSIIKLLGTCNSHPELSLQDFIILLHFYSLNETTQIELASSELQPITRNTTQSINLRLVKLKQEGYLARRTTNAGRTYLWRLTPLGSEKTETILHTHNLL